MIGPLAVSLGCAIALAAAGGLLTEVGPWYRALRKPRLQPPDWLFGPAWTVILGLAAVSGALAWVDAPDSAGRLRVVGLFATNGLLHLLWSPLFFKAKRPDWALAEVPLLFLSVAAMMVGVAPFSHVAAWMLSPYLIWVGFATYLNYAIVRLNGPFRRA